MPELHLQHVGEQLSITLGEYTSTVVWANIASWTPEEVFKDAKFYGHTLFEQITGNADLRTALMGLRKNERLVLVAEQPEVAAVPWEYLRFPVNSQLDGLLLATRYNLVRGVIQNCRDRMELTSTLTIVIIPVSPIDELRVLNTEHEWQNLTEAIRRQERVLQLIRVRPPTLGAMKRELNAKGTKIVQFMGHSKVEDDKGVLSFEDEVGRSKSIGAVLFANALDKQTFIVILNSCDSAVSSNASNTQDIPSQLSNIAQSVVREGVPYALGMQFELPNSAAYKISEFLYESLLQERDIEEAVCDMRSKLEQNAMLTNASWLAGVPTLYTNMREPMAAFRLSRGEPLIFPNLITETRDITALSPVEHFTGRSEQISEALTILLNTSVRGFVVLHGLGGIGKTALACVIAERVSWHYQDRVLAYSFETFARFDDEGVIIHTPVNVPFAERFYSSLAFFYDINPRDFLTTDSLRKAILRQRKITRSLLILDNIETLIYAQKNGNEEALELATFVSSLKESDSPVLLITRAMPPSDWGQRKEIHLTGLSDDAAEKLFLASIANDRRRDTTPETRIALSHYVKGHPLCIRLLAGRFSESSAADLATFLQNIQDELVNAKQTTFTSFDDPRRHTTISDCMDYSIRRLPPELKTVLYAIGIFRAPFTQSSAESVLENKKQTKKHLQDLVRLGLLERTYAALADSQYDTYELHPMLRLYI